MRRRGEPLSLLYPFSPSFYQKHGYGLVEWVDHLRVAPRQLPPSPLRARVRKLTLPADLAEIRRAFRERALLGRQDKLLRALVRRDGVETPIVLPKVNP